MMMVVLCMAYKDAHHYNCIMLMGDGLFFQISQRTFMIPFIFSSHGETSFLSLHSTINFDLHLPPKFVIQSFRMCLVH